jgi:hypothetical protein
MRFDLIGKRSDDRVELGLIFLHLLSIGVQTRTTTLLKSVSVTRQLHIQRSHLARALPDKVGCGQLQANQ